MERSGRMSAQHTPTPWRVYDAGDENYPGIDAGWRSVVMFGNADEECGVRGDTREEAEANARFIVHAVNCHDELLAALEQYASGYVDSGAHARAVIAKALGAPVA